MDFTFSKKERITSKILIEEIFARGGSLYSFPLKIVYLNSPSQETSCCQFMVSVSKKRFRRANKRNLLKRRMREAIRKNKHILLQAMESEKAMLAIVFIYHSNQICSYRLIEQTVHSLLSQVSKLFARE
jgi:ribonuclease P protein component